jgi:hypothetical protein
MRQPGYRGFILIIAALIIAGGLAGWATAVAVDYLQTDTGSADPRPPD